MSAATPTELQWDLDNLRTAWEQIAQANEGRAAPFLIYQESDAVTRALRDYLGDDIGEILVDDAGAFQKAQEYMTRFMPPEAQRRLKLYQDDVPLFTRFQIESQIESAYSHKVTAALRRQPRDRSHRGAGLDRHQLRALDARRATSRPRRSTPTSRRPTRSRASCACATSAG